MAETTKIIIIPELDKAGLAKLENTLENRLTQSSEQAGQTAGRGFSKGFGANLSFKSLVGAGVVVAAATRGIQALSSAVSGSIQNLRDFERSTAEVNTLLSENAKLTEQTKNAFIGFSSAFGTDAQTQVRAFYNIVSAGVEGTTNQLRTLRAANKAATAGLVDIDTAAKVLVSSVNSYAASGLTATEASDALFEAVRLGQTTFGELAATLGRVAPLAASAGVNFGELSGTLAFLTKSGVSTDEAVTGVRNILTQVIKPSADAAKFAKQLGLDFNVAAIRAQGFAGFLQNVIRATGGSSEQLARLFGNVRALTPIVQVANGNFQEFEQILERTQQSAGATATAFRDISANLDFRLAQRTQEFQNFFLVLSRTATQTFNGLLVDLIPNVGRISDIFITLGKVINVALVAPLEVVGRAFSVFFDGIGALVTGFLSSVVGAAAKVLSFFGADGELQQALQSFAEGSDLAFDGFFKNTVEGFDNLFAGTLFDKTGEFLTNLETNLEQARTAIDNSGIQESIGNLSGTPNVEQGETPAGVGIFNPANVDILGQFASGFRSATADAAKFNTAVQNLGKSARTTLANGFARGFSAIGQALVQGGNGLQDFGKIILGTFGQLATQIGAFFILQGTGFLLSGQPGGAGLIAAGVGLSLLGGVLSGIAGGGASAPAPAVSSTGGFGPEADTGGSLSEPLEAEEENARIAVNIQGDVLDSAETGLRIVEILNDNFDTTGATVTRGAFA